MGEEKVVKLKKKKKKLGLMPEMKLDRSLKIRLLFKYFSFSTILISYYLAALVKRRALEVSTTRFDH